MKKIFKPKFNLRRQIIWADRLSLLLSSGISISEAVSLLAETSSDAYMRRLNEDIYQKISKGTSLSTCLEDIHGAHRLLVRSVHVGEATGALSDMLVLVARNFSSREEIKQKIVGASMYPACIGVATFGVAGFLVGYIFPKVMPLFQSMHIVLPLPTRILLGFSHFVSVYWIYISLSVLVILASVVYSFMKVLKVKNAVEDIVLYMPIIGNTFRSYINSHIFQVVSMLLDHGVGLPNSLREVGMSVGSVRYRGALEHSALMTERGRTLSETLSEYPRLFSREDIGLLAISEKSGSLSQGCANIARIASADVDRILTTVTRLIEPILMLAMGLIVGSIALSIIMPIYEITSHVTAH